MPEFSEAKVYAALGLSAPEAQGAREQEPAAPASDPHEPAAPAAGANDQGVAAPETSGNAGTSEPVAAPAQDPASEEPGSSSAQSVEERRANAARRRQEEQQAVIDAAVAAARQEERRRADQALENLFTQAGMRNTFTGEPIKTLDDFNAWQTRFRNEQLQNQLAKGQLTVDSLNALVDDHPVVKQAKAVLAANSSENGTVDPRSGASSSPASAPPAVPPQPNAAQQAADNARIQAEIAEISKLDPSVRNLGDILNSPTGKEFYANVQKGHSFLDAFRLANFERITASKAEAARQQAVTNSRGKDHLNGVSTNRSDGALSVPAADMAMFRTFNPNAKEADIQAYYNKYMKGR